MQNTFEDHLRNSGLNKALTNAIVEQQWPLLVLNALAIDDELFENVMNELAQYVISNPISGELVNDYMKLLKTMISDGTKKCLPVTTKWVLRHFITEFVELENGTVNVKIDDFMMQIKKSDTYLELNYHLCLKNDSIRDLHVIYSEGHYKMFCSVCEKFIIIDNNNFSIDMEKVEQHFCLENRRLEG